MNVLGFYQFRTLADQGLNVIQKGVGGKLARAMGWDFSALGRDPQNVSGGICSTSLIYTM